MRSRRNPRAARRAYLTTGVFSLGFYFVTATIGLIALVLYPHIQPDQALPTVVLRLLPVGVVGFTLAALLAVIQSTASSYLNSTAIVFVKDLYIPFVRPGASDRHRLVAQRVVTFVVGAAAVGFALVAPSIIGAFVIAYNLWAPTVVIPLVAAVVWGLRSPSAGLAAMICGGAATALWEWGMDEPYGLSGIVVGVLVNALVFAGTYVFAPRHPRLLQHTESALAVKGAVR